MPRQLGNIYHHIFEQLYRATTDPADLDALLAALPAAADAVLDAAPRVEGFRATAWWLQSRAEIAANVRRSVEALAALPGGFVPLAQEAAFVGSASLTVTAEDDAFRLRGYIDRVDRAPDGGLRIIDYKTAGRQPSRSRPSSRGRSSSCRSTPWRPSRRWDSVPSLTASIGTCSTPRRASSP